MRITYLGSGNAFAPRRDWASILVNGTVLLDAGPSILVNIKRLGIDPAVIRHIFISHFHGDHYFGLPFLLLEYYFLSPTDAPLTIIGPPGIEARVRQLMTLAYPNEIERGWPRPITFVEAAPGHAQVADGLTFSAIPVEHAVGTLSAFGYRLCLHDGVLAYTGDTTMTDALYTLIDGARACIIEATAQDESNVHIGRKALQHLLDQAPNVTFLLNHLDTPDAGPWAGMRVIVPNDLQTYEV